MSVFPLWNDEHQWLDTGISRRWPRMLRPHAAV